MDAAAAMEDRLDLRSAIFPLDARDDCSRLLWLDHVLRRLEALQLTPVASVVPMGSCKTPTYVQIHLASTRSTVNS
jgi:hypothetical protein